MKTLTMTAVTLSWLLYVCPGLAKATAPGTSATPATVTSAPVAASGAPAPPPPVRRDDGPPEYRQAVDLIHAYSGGDELDRVEQIANELAAKHPTDGYSEALLAEAISTWQLDTQDGTPAEAAAEAVKLADEAKRLNPGLSLPYISKARVLVRSSQYQAAVAEMNAVQAVEPGLASADFLYAEILRRTGRFEESARQYAKFISKVDSPARKSNGYVWMALSYVAAHETGQGDRKANLAGARQAYEKSVELDPTPWKTINYVAFLNSLGEDYVTAEALARRALALRDMPIAHMHIAIARYQQLLAKIETATKPELKAGVVNVQLATGISLDELLSSGQLAESTQARLTRLRERF
jgi:tetratricopeptide (TPR) repeat protein